jgi:hypothetical protein
VKRDRQRVWRVEGPIAWRADPVRTQNLLHGLARLECVGVGEENKVDVLKKEGEIFLKLLEINRNLNSKLVLNDLIDLILDTVLEVTGAERGFLLLREGDGVAVRGARNMDRERIKDPSSRSPVHSLTVLSGEAITATTPSGPRFQPPERRQAQHEVGLCAPIKGRTRRSGSSRDNRFQPPSRRTTCVARILSDQAAVASNAGSSRRTATARTARGCPRGSSANLAGEQGPVEEPAARGGHG